MCPIIRKNNVADVIGALQEYVQKIGIIKGVCLVDISEDQVVLLLDDKPIDKEHAQIWWEGYRAALE